jgi:hypothetical protein
MCLVAFLAFDVFSGAGVAAGSVVDAAVPEALRYVLNLAHVFGPTLPSATKPLADWNALTAFFVFAPPFPSVAPE